MSKLWFFPALLGINFLLFEHKHTCWFRNLMSKTWFTNFLAQCIFCRCCWIGAGLAFSAYNVTSVTHLFLIGVSSGILGLIFVVTFTPCLRVWERHHR